VREHSPHTVWTGYPRQGDLFVEVDESAELQPEALEQETECIQ
jgi:hypothetical protein